MEIEIDTSLLSHSSVLSKNVIHSDIDISNNLSKIEESIEKKISVFSKDTIEETITIKPKRIIVVNNKDNKAITVYGTICKNNQTFYSLAVNDEVLVFSYNEDIINLIKENKDITIEIQKSYIYKIDNKDKSINLTNYIKLTQLYFPFMLSLYFTILSQYKYDRYHNILLYSSNDKKCSIYKHLLSLLGYTNIDINTLSSSHTYNHIIDFTSSLLSKESKATTFNLLTYNGIYHSLSSPLLTTQLIPNDLTIISKKCLSIHFIDIKEEISHIMSIGKMTNFIYDFSNKIYGKYDEMIKQIELEEISTDSISSIDNKYIILLKIN